MSHHRNNDNKKNRKVNWSRTQQNGHAKRAQHIRNKESMACIMQNIIFHREQPEKSENKMFKAESIYRINFSEYSLCYIYL